MPKRMQYSAANIGKGMDANTAPNFPTDDHRKIKQNQKTSIKWNCFFSFLTDIIKSKTISVNNMMRNWFTSCVIQAHL